MAHKDYITANAMDEKDKHMMIIIDDEQAKVVRNIFNRYWGYSIGGIIKRLETNGIKSPKEKDHWNNKGIESTLTRQKYTEDVAIVGLGASDNQYLNKDHNEEIISKE